jgi:hypothetical protein
MLHPDLITLTAVVGLILIATGLCVALVLTLRSRDRAEQRARTAERLLNHRKPEVMAALQHREAKR